MKRTILLLTLSLAAFAADTKAPAEKPKGPEPIPAAEQESISRKMLVLQMHANRIAQLKIQTDSAQKDLDAASKDWEQTLSALREKYHAKNCDLNLDKTWACASK